MKNPKGCYGYLKRQQKREILKTILYFALSAAIFIMGYLSTGTKMNLLTIVAVLGCLPASKSAVSMIMYIKAGRCSRACYQTVQTALGEQGAASSFYDLYLTSYRKNFQISAMVIRNQVLCGYTEDPGCDLAAGEKHIMDMLQQNGYGGMTVKLFADLQKFTDRAVQMYMLPEKSTEKEAAVAQLIKEISL